MFLNKKQPFNLEEVLNGCRKKNSAAQKRLFEHFYGLAKSICLRYSSSIEEADEMLNDGFMKVFNNLDKYQNSHAFEAWFRTVIVRTCIDYIRKFKSKVETLDVDEQYDLEYNDSIIEKISADDIIQLIQKLPPVYRTVFSMYVVDGFSHAEIALQLGINEGTSRSNLSKARLKLQEWVKKNLEEPEIY